VKVSEQGCKTNSAVALEFSFYISTSTVDSILCKIGSLEHQEKVTMLMKRWKRSQLRGKDKSQSDTPSPCLCVPLHLNCDPVLCSEAPSHATLQALGCEQLAKSEHNEPKVLVECTLSDIRKAALQRCSTCSILYTGLQNPKSRRRRGNDDDVQVRIKTNGNVDVYNTLNGYFDGEYDFLASASSGALKFSSWIVNGPFS
jgi:hypothetical protein